MSITVVFNQEEGLKIIRENVPSLSMDVTSPEISSTAGCALDVIDEDVQTGKEDGAKSTERSSRVSSSQNKKSENLSLTSSPQREGVDDKQKSSSEISFPYEGVDTPQRVSEEEIVLKVQSSHSGEPTTKYRMLFPVVKKIPYSFDSSKGKMGIKKKMDSPLPLQHETARKPAGPRHARSLPSSDIDMDSGSSSSYSALSKAKKGEQGKHSQQIKDGPARADKEKEDKRHRRSQSISKRPMNRKRKYSRTSHSGHSF